MKKLYGVIIAFLFSLTVWSQTVASYSFTEFAGGGYTPITGGTNLPSTATVPLDEQFSPLMPIGFNFNYAGSSFSQFSFNANGNIVLGQIAGNNFPHSVLSDGDKNFVISPMNNDLMGYGLLLVDVTTGNDEVTVMQGDITHINVGDEVSVHGFVPGTIVLGIVGNTLVLSNTATDDGLLRPLRFFNSAIGIRYETSGVAPNRRLTVQWSGFSRQSGFQPYGELYNFQVILFETTGTIEFVYDIKGPSSVDPAEYQVGLRGATNADFNNRTTIFDWSATFPGATNDATMLLDNIVRPVTGQKYTWMPVCSSPLYNAPVIIPDCVNSQYSFSVNFTSLGSATSLTFSGPASPAVLNAPGVVTFGPFAAGIASGNITVQHNLNNGCDVVLPSQLYFCPPAHDECINAFPFPAIPANGTCMTLINQSTEGATQSMAPCTGDEANDVWYRFDAPGPVVMIDVSSSVGAGPPFNMVTQVFGGSCGSLTSLSCTDSGTPVATVSGLTTGNTYFVRVHRFNASFFNGFNICIKTPVPAPPNDNVSGAILLNVNGACAGPYDITSATAAVNEPFPSCSGTITAPVWFSFVAPAGGAVSVSTDFAGHSLSNSKIALYSGSDLVNYSDFQVISCDDNNGTAAGTTGLLSVLYATGLTPGVTYYIAVDKFDAATTDGTFCIAVDELSAAHLSSADDCTLGQFVASNGVTNYTGWVPLTDNSSRLIALVRRAAGVDPSGFTVSQNMNPGPVVRSTAGVFYLDRNYHINNASATNTQVQFFYLNSELNALIAAKPGTTAANLGVVRQAGAFCQFDFSSVNGVSTFLPPLSNGVTTDGLVRWTSVTTPSFSNFFLQANVGPVLPVQLLNFSGAKEGGVYKLKWETASEQNCAGFEIQRSADGVNFIPVAFVDSRAPGGYSDLPLAYTYSDVFNSSGKVYYRLKQTDLDNHYRMSNVLLLKGSAGSGFAIESISPNPVSGSASISISSPVPDNVLVLISDMSGKVLMSRRARVESGANTLSFDASGLAKGVYLVRVQGTGGEVSATSRFIRQ